MRAFVLLLCAATVAAHPSFARSQTCAAAPAPLDLDGTPQRPVLLTAREVIRAADDPLPEGLTPLQRAMHTRDRIYNGMVSVELSVALNLNGRVESAKPLREPQRFYERAEELEMHRVTTAH